MFIRWTLIILFISQVCYCKAQAGFMTLVPNHPVVPGESFQVQYIISETGKIGGFKAPSFKYFRFVSGPNQYNGTVNSINANIPVTNFVFTLEATRPGRFIIPGAMVLVDGKQERSNEAVVEVISKEDAAKLFDRKGAMNTDYLLRPGEDPYEKIRQNLFLKVAVDRTHCFAGEPVLATFKLYSRLESKSDIVKNPGFYGFTVYDMVNLADKRMTTENVNGKIFNVHTIRKVQLYPLQEGRFVIDAMEVGNKVEFSRSIISKKTEQEIVEGMSGNNDATAEGKEIVETSMSTEPISVNVKPVPVKNKPDGFNAAVGDFFIAASLVKDSIAKNEENVLEIAVTGRGNFTQLNAPVIKWPAGIEAFEPVIKDELDKTKVPLTGSRLFRYTFFCANPGIFQLPPLIFSFFNPDSNKYKTISTWGSNVTVSNQEKIYSTAGEKKISIADKNAKASRIAAGIIISIVLLILVYLARQKKEPVSHLAGKKLALPLVDEILAPSYSLTNASQKEFYSSLQQGIWNFFGQYFNLSGSEMNKENLLAKIKAGSADTVIAVKIQNILEQCEEGIFTGASLGTDKNNLLMETKEVLETFSASLL
jgi:uncharacterized integral membrane protein